MKIIRLVSQSTEGLFDNDFNEDIVVEPNSSIALHSLTAEIDIEQITIDAQDDEIKFKMFDTDTEYKVLHITHGIYNSSNYSDLFNDITIKMNSLMSNRLGEIGFQWQIATDLATKKVNFCNSYGEYITPTSVGSVKYDNKNLVGTAGGPVGSGVSGVWNRNAGVVGNYDAFLYFKTPNSKAASTFRAKIYKDDGFTDGFIIGYTTTAYNSNTLFINPLDIKYGIKCTAIGDTYSTILNGIETDTGVEAEVVGTNNTGNDYLSIDIYNGSINFNLTRGVASTTVNLLTSGDVYNHSTNLFPVIIFLGDANCRLFNITFSSDAFYNKTNTLTFESSLTALPSGGAGRQGIRTLVFSDVDLAKYLGYKTTTYEITSIDFLTEFIAENTFSPSDFSDSFVIELQNLNIDSYDGLTNKRRNLLHSIVQADVIRNRLTYTAPYPLFLSLNNQHKIVLRRLRARLLREDLTPASLTGYSQISLIINN